MEHDPHIRDSLARGFQATRRCRCSFPSSEDKISLSPSTSQRAREEACLHSFKRQPASVIMSVFTRVVFFFLFFLYFCSLLISSRFSSNRRVGVEFCYLAMSFSEFMFAFPALFQTLPSVRPFRLFSCFRLPLLAAHGPR